MARVVLTERAAADLDDLILSHGLPADANRALAARWDGARFILGPWPWLIIVYEYDEPDDVVIVHALRDGRSATAGRPS